MDRAADISKENFRIVSVIPSVSKQPEGRTSAAAMVVEVLFDPRTRLES